VKVSPKSSNRDESTAAYANNIVLRNVVQTVLLKAANGPVLKADYDAAIDALNELFRRAA